MLRKWKDWAMKCLSSFEHSSFHVVYSGHYHPLLFRVVWHPCRIVWILLKNLFLKCFFLYIPQKHSLIDKYKVSCVNSFLSNGNLYHRKKLIFQTSIHYIFSLQLNNNEKYNNIKTYLKIIKSSQIFLWFLRNVINFN